MSKHSKLLQKILQGLSDKNIPFSEVRSLLKMNTKIDDNDE